MATAQPRRTPWFKGDVKPVREGQYEVKSGHETRMALWEDERWWRIDDNNARDEELGEVKQWRGLASEPRPAEAKPEPEKAARLEEEAAEAEEAEEEITDQDIGRSDLPL